MSTLISCMSTEISCISTNLSRMPTWYIIFIWNVGSLVLAIFHILCIELVFIILWLSFAFPGIATFYCQKDRRGYTDFACQYNYAGCRHKTVACQHN